MPKMEQALVLDPPAELHFKGPFMDVTTSYLNLTNPTDKQICFKVKTTAPKTYCVRPNSGVVAPKETVIVAVMLQPFDIESADRSKHKFMVQTMFAPDGEFNQDTLWRDAAPDTLMNSKLRCVFDIPGEPVLNNVDTAEVKEDKDAVSSKSSSETFTVFAPKSSNVEFEVKKLLETNKKLKDELSEVQQENSRLKEEGLRLRVARSSGGAVPGGIPFDSQYFTGLPSYPIERQKTADGGVSQKPFLLVSAVIIFLVGLYLGVYVL